MWNMRKCGTAKSLHRERTRHRRGAPPLRGELPESTHSPARLCVSVLALGWFLFAPPGYAVEFGEGEFYGSLDTTISHGVIIRVEERDDYLAGEVNSNDGNLNYDRGVVSNTSKFTSDLELGVGNFGAFARVTGFIDFENEDGDRDRTDLHDDARDQVGKDLELLDAYVTGAFDLGGAAVDLRLGKHVLNWGESTFISNGINAINPFDVSKLRLPGSELREGLVPVPMASASVAAGDNLSVEGFYQLEWDGTEIDPVGTYFSVTDYVGAGAEKAVITLPGVNITDTGLGPDSALGIEPLIPALDSDIRNAQAAHLGLPPEALPPVLPDPLFLTVKHGPDREPEDAGQGGISLRYFAEALNGTEFGLYFVNYHSRLPLVSAEVDTLGGINAGLAAAGAVGAPSSATVAAVTQLVTPAVTQEVTNAVMAGLLDPAVAEAAIRAGVQEQVSAQIGGIAPLLAIDSYAEHGYYFYEYPEDLSLFGLSFNTQLGASGWALQGEYSLRPDAPLQRAERVLFAEGLEPITTALALSSDPAALGAYLAGTAPKKVVKGYEELDVSQIQVTATKALGSTLGADSAVFLTEAALMHVHGMPEDLFLESPAGSAASDPADIGAGERHPADADATSWGYRMAARLDYNNAIGAINLYPYVQFQHDVSGNSPAPSGPFAEGRTALTLGLSADYLSRWQAALGYTRYGGDRNELHDRDFVYASVKYSF